MIYKFTDSDSSMEIELVHDKKEINFTIETVDYQVMNNINKEDVFKLIGVLHLLYKEMV